MEAMRPQPDDLTIKLPVTFDYHGGRADNKRGNILVSLVLTVIVIIFEIGIARNDSMEWYIRLAICIVLFLVYFIFLRYKVLRERVYSDALETLKEMDFQPSSTSFWGIYDIDVSYPYVCHFSDGKKGIFIKLEKDVVVGKPDTIMYDHFEAISDAYCLAGSLNINLAQIDYMDNVGNDPRMQNLYDDLEDCENEDMRDIMLSMYAYLQDEMSNDYASFDVYLLTTRTKVSQLWYNAQMVCERLLTGNYLSYKVLDSEGIKATVTALMNLNEFSVLDACENVLRNSSMTKSIVPISVEHGHGDITKIGKTQEELKQEKLEKEKQEEARRASKQRGRKKDNTSSKIPTFDEAMNQVTSSDSVDLFKDDDDGDSDIDLF